MEWAEAVEMERQVEADHTDEHGQIDEAGWAKACEVADWLIQKAATELNWNPDGVDDVISINEVLSEAMRDSTEDPEARCKLGLNAAKGEIIRLRAQDGIALIAEAWAMLDKIEDQGWRELIAEEIAEAFMELRR